MANKSSSEKSREEEELAHLDAMMGSAFGAADEIEEDHEIGNVDDGASQHKPSATELDSEQHAQEAQNEPPEESSPSGPPSGPPPSGPPSGPPRSPPPSGPPSGPPSSPPSGPPSIEPPSDLTFSEETEVSVVEMSSEIQEDPADEEQPAEESIPEHVEESVQEHPTPDAADETEAAPVEAPSEESAPEQGQSPQPEPVEQTPAVQLLEAEVQRLEGALQGAVEVIKDLEQPNMPPVVEGNIVIAGHLVNDFVRLGKQLDRDHLVRGNLGGLAMLHPGQPGVMVATKHMVMLASMDERSICIGHMGSGMAPRGATLDWRSFEVVLATVSMVTGGPAAAIRMHSPYTTAASCEKDLVLVQPIDAVGQKNLGKIIIVEPDDIDQDEYLRQLVEALQQGGMRAVVVRGHGAFAVGADFNQAWANAAMLEQSMQIYLLARQANLRI